MKKILFLLSVSLVILLLTSCSDQPTLYPPVESTVLLPNTSESETLPPEEQYTEITIAAIGDILIHNTLYLAAYDDASGTYDFTPQFRYVKPYLEKAHITVANLETSLGGAEQGYSGYPLFNTPDSIIDALRYAGVDIVTGANNHRLDTGPDGFYRTIRTVREKGLDIIGVRAAADEPRYLLKEVQGVKIAFLNFGYCYLTPDHRKNLNGLLLPQDMSPLIDTFTADAPAETAAGEIQAVLTQAYQSGADAALVFLHWGDEYHRLPNTFQEDLAELLAESGATAIIGGHPHVLQPAVYHAGKDGENVPVFYSLGNFISDQRLETVDNIYTEQGLIAYLTLRIYENGQVEASADCEPTWVNKKRQGGKLIYEVIPAADALAQPEQYPLLTPEDLQRIHSGLESTKQDIIHLD